MYQATDHEALSLLPLAAWAWDYILPPIHSQLMLTAVNWVSNWVFSSSILTPGIRLDVDSVFQLLKKTGRNWNNVAESILFIQSKDKRDEIRNHFSTDDDRLRESIQFWLRRCPFASYRMLAFVNVSTKFVEPISGKK